MVHVYGLWNCKGAVRGANQREDLAGGPTKIEGVCRVEVVVACRGELVARCPEIG